MATANLTQNIAARTFDAWSQQLQWSNVWDTIALGRLKWYLTLTWVLGWLVTKIIYSLPISYLWPKAINFWPKDIYYWNSSGYLPQYPRIFFWGNYLWVESALYHELGLALGGIIVLFFIVACLREQQASRIRS